METSPRLETNPAAFSYGWVLFVLNAIVVAYTSTLEVFPSPFLRQLTLLYNTKASIITYTLSFYYYALIIFQIPAALLTDKCKTSLFIIASPLISGLSSLLFSQSHTLFTAGMTRFFMGIGTTFAFLHSIKCIADWFPAKTFAIRFGFFIALELLLTLAFSALFDSVIQSSGWRQAFLYFGISGLILACLVFLTMRGFKEKYYFYFPEKQPELKPLLRKLFDSSQMWVIGFASGVSIGIVYAFLSRWAVPIFTLAYRFSLTDAIFLILVANIGYACGTPLFTYFSTLLKQRKLFIPWSLAIAIFMLVTIIYPPYLTNYLITIASFLLGFAVSAANLGYVIIHEQNAPQITATAIASINIFYALSLVSFDTIITVFLRAEAIVKDTAQYTLQDLETALFRLPIYFAFAFLFSFFIRKTHAKQYVEPPHG